MDSDQPSRTPQTRRDFLKTSAAMAAAGSVPFWFATGTNLAAAFASPNERPVAPEETRRTLRLVVLLQVGAELLDRFLLVGAPGGRVAPPFRGVTGGSPPGKHTAPG